MVMVDVVSSLGDNPYFGAGFGLFGVGMLAAVARRGSQVGIALFRRYGMTTVEVTCRDKSYDWLLQWIVKRGAQDTQHLSVDTSFVESDSGKIKTQYDFHPSVGVHMMRFRNTWIRMERTREQRMMEPWETIQLTTLGRNRQLFTQILEEARAMAMEKHSGKTVIYTVLGIDWRQFGHPRPRRSIDSVILDDGVSDRIRQDIRDFMANPTWYRQRGIPYRRGYLLYGPPGCGKTSYISALAGDLEYSICILNLSDRSLTDDLLQHRLADAPENSIILLEDVDAAFVSREDLSGRELDSAYQGMNRLTFSGLLNALDGATSSEGRILFMTTNYVDRLDPALVRPGRVDVMEYIGYCSASQLRSMFLRFYPEQAQQVTDLPRQFVENVLRLDIHLSPAQIQGYFLRHKHHPDEAVRNVSQLTAKMMKP